MSNDRETVFEAIPGWHCNRLHATHALVAGVGALGNRLLQDLALIGIGRLTLVDPDRIEAGNLTRAPLFNEADIGRPKVDAAAERLRLLAPECQLRIFDQKLEDLDANALDADLFLGAVDNRACRLTLNGLARRHARPFFDGGIGVSQAIIRGFAPPHTACYACTLGDAAWADLNQRQGCARLAEATPSGSAPTTPMLAAIAAGLLVNEIVRYLHGELGFLGKGLFIDAAGRTMSDVVYPRRPDCPYHG